MMTESVVNNMEQLGILMTAGGLQNGISPLENNLAISYKVRYTFTIWPNNSTARQTQEQ